MKRGVHGEKLISAYNSKKLPEYDKERIKIAIERYDKWIQNLNAINEEDITTLVNKMVEELNDYKKFIDLDLIFDSKEDFLYRQKGQLKLDNTIIEEFLPILVGKAVMQIEGKDDIIIDAQTPTFSSLHFTATLNNPMIGGGMNIKTKDQDFSLSRRIYIQSSYSSDFEPDETLNITTYLGYIMAELKTNLDKTMYQEASATARDIKLAVVGAKYYLLCDYLDMKPLSTETTDIDEILILRKAKRINSNIRSSFSTYEGRKRNRDFYENYLIENPYDPEVFERFVGHIMNLVSGRELDEDSVLTLGYF